MAVSVSVSRLGQASIGKQDESRSAAGQSQHSCHPACVGWCVWAHECVFSLHSRESFAIAATLRGVICLSLAFSRFAERPNNPLFTYASQPGQRRLRTLLTQFLPTSRQPSMSTPHFSDAIVSRGTEEVPVTPISRISLRKLRAFPEHPISGAPNRRDPTPNS
jgi:hypothetical protein